MCPAWCLSPTAPSVLQHPPWPPPLFSLSLSRSCHHSSSCHINGTVTVVMIPFLHCLPVPFSTLGTCLLSLPQEHGAFLQEILCLFLPSHLCLTHSHIQFQAKHNFFREVFLRVHLPKPNLSGNFTQCCVIVPVRYTQGRGRIDRLIAVSCHRALSWVHTRH